MKKLIDNKFLKYVCFAILTSIINVGIYLLVYNLIINSILISNICAYTISITFSFLINKVVVFQNKDKKLKKQLTMFLGVKLISFVIDSLVLFICHDILNIGNLISKIIANCSTTLNNYTLNNKHVFRKRDY